MFFSQFIKFQTFSGVYVLKVLIKMLMKNYHQISRQLVVLLRLITEIAHLTLSCYYYCVKKKRWRSVVCSGQTGHKFDPHSLSIVAQLSDNKLFLLTNRIVGNVINQSNCWKLNMAEKLTIWVVLHVKLVVDHLRIEKLKV